MVEFDLSKITGREPPTDDGLPCACEWNAAGEPVGLCAAHQSKLDDELAALRAERDDLRAENELLQEQVMATQRDDDGIDALRARIAELEAGLRSITAADPSETQLEAYVHWVHDTVRGLLQSAGAGL